MTHSTLAAIILVTFCLLLISSSIFTLSTAFENPNPSSRSKASRPKASVATVTATSAVTMSGHDDVTLQLAKKEQKEHLGPEMASLLNDMTNRDIIVAASPLDSSPPETPGYTTLKSKTVHFIRHGQGKESKDSTQSSNE